VQELDSEECRELALKANRVATGSLTRHEVRTVFRRREAEGVLPSGESASLYDELTADIAATDIVIQPDTPDRPITENFPMSKVNDALDLLRSGKTRYRVVLVNEQEA
jgi:hypothetical protein